jgi:glycosyltransferase involved in cell wall biosynthesis
MRILYVVPRYWPSIGGAQVVSRELIRRVATNHSIAVVTQFTSGRDSFVDSVVRARPGEYCDGEIPVYRIGPTRGWRPLLTGLSWFYGRTRLVRPIFAWLLQRALEPQLAGLIARYRPEIVHAAHIGLVYSSEIAWRAARRGGVPFVWTPFPHIYGPSGWRGPRFRRLYRAADAVIAMTGCERAWLIEQGASASRIHVIPPGPLAQPQHDATGFRQTHCLDQWPVVLFLAQKLLYKGYRQVVEAARLVWRERPEARFVFVGPRTTESEQFFAIQSDPRIIELPAVDELTKSSALAACDIFCMPSTQESLGVVYLEAWSFRKPVIAADIEIAREVIADGEDGLLVPQEAPAIAEAILKLLRDDAVRMQMGEAGCRKVRECYDWERLTGQIEAVYRDLVERTAGAQQ